MATGLSSYLANELLDAIGSDSSFSIDSVYVQLHIGSPGANGTANPATETTRKAVSFNAAVNGEMASNQEISWTNIAGSQDATFFSAWDSSTNGNFLFSGTISGNAYIAGDTYVISSGSLSVSLAIAS